jgi:cytochrome c553
MRAFAWIGYLYLFSSAVNASEAVNTLLQEYQQAGAQHFSVEAGQKLWNQKNPQANQEVRQCASCHTQNLRVEGKHAETGKVIQPLAPSANPKRLTEVKEIQKWLLRNCKWTFGRECSAQEKGDILTYLQTQ